MTSFKPLLIVNFLLALSFTGCSTNSDSENGIFRNQSGFLLWAGSPAVDGAGMLFEVKEVQYGVPGSPEDYPRFFYDGTNPVEVVADFRLTGKQAIRGWGTAYLEIEFLRIKKLD